MKCPYNILPVIETWATVKTDKDSGSSEITTKYTSYDMPDCLQKECGAYKDGQCNYSK